MTPEEVKSIRAALGWSQRKVADDIGVDVMSVSRWERGVNEPKGASLKALQRLAKRAAKK
jgi:DNA-binding transcriptional regulator YiaG